MLKNKIFKTLLLIRNIILTLASLACVVLAIILLINAYIDKLEGEGISYAIGLIFGIIFLAVGLGASVFLIFYLIISVKALKNLDNKNYNSIMLALEVIVLLITTSIMVFQMVNIDIVVIIILSIIIIQSVIIIIFLSKILKKQIN